MTLIGRVCTALFLVLAVVACGDEDETPGADPVTGVGVEEGAEEIEAEDAGETIELQTAVESYAQAVISGDPDAAIELLSSACADVEVVEPAGHGEVSREDVSRAALAFYEAEVDGETATVSYRYDEPVVFEAQEERWVKEDGEWKWDNC